MAKFELIKVEMIVYYDPETQIDDFDCYTKDQVDSYYWEEWLFVGVRARATFELETPIGPETIVKESPGLWGINYNYTKAADKYLQEVFEDEYQILFDDVISKVHPDKTTIQDIVDNDMPDHFEVM